VLVKILSDLHAGNWLILSRVSSEFQKIAASPDLWRPRYYLKFYYHAHQFDTLVKINWKDIYKECYLTEQAGPQVIEHMKTIDDKRLFSPKKKKQFHCGWVPTCVVVTILGGPGCGKSSLIRAIKGKELDCEYISTMGAQKIKHLFPIEADVIEFDFWDCSGQERYNGMNQKIVTFCDIVVLAYDCSDVDSFDSLQTIWSDIIQKSRHNFQTCVVGCKSDTEESERGLSIAKMTEFAQQRGVPYFGEVSSLTRDNLEEFMSDLYKLHLKKNPPQ